jgi:hypothetical protein
MTKDSSKRRAEQAIVADGPTALETMLKKARAVALASPMLTDDDRRFYLENCNVKTGKLTAEENVWVAAIFLRLPETGWAEGERLLTIGKATRTVGSVRTKQGNWFADKPGRRMYIEAICPSDPLLRMKPVVRYYSVGEWRRRLHELAARAS